MTIFIDTSFIIALINQRDQYHTQALDLSDLYSLNKERHYERN
ncbi:MAG: hypothetical protein ACK5BG_00845 [Pseudanabaena sp.]